MWEEPTPLLGGGLRIFLMGRQVFVGREPKKGQKKRKKMQRHLSPPTQTTKSLNHVLEIQMFRVKCIVYKLLTFKQFQTTKYLSFPLQILSTAATTV